VGIEIERKFLVADRSCLMGVNGVRIAQGYLSLDPDRTVRVRLAGDDAWITIKGRSDGLRRAEFEFPIPPDDASELLAMCLHSVIDKTRHRIASGDHVWEVDVFHGDNQGLVIAEVELSDESDLPHLPPWLGAEVTHDPRFLNANLATAPFRSFHDAL
jgi:adenylate cyclase